MYPGVELRLLRYVVAIAEELHFSKAAAKLHVSQPSLSKQIRGLEAELGATLFERTSRQVRLTREGERFVAEARKALFHSQRAVQVARMVHRTPMFRLGYSPFVNPRMIGRVRGIRAAEIGGAEIKLISAFEGSPLPQVRNGEFEAGLLLLPVAQCELSVEPLWSEPLQAVLPAGDRLVRSRRRLRLQDLQSIPFVSIGGHLHPATHACLMDACGARGFVPEQVQDVATFAEAAHMVAEGLGFTFSRPWPDRLSCPGVAFKAIEGNPLVIETGMVYGHAAGADVIAKLIAVLADACADRGRASHGGEAHQAAA